jgi:predicted DNA-binding transcriptional regulator YafY
MRRTDRLFEIIQLFRKGSLLKGSDIAEVLEVSQRTVYRDIETLVASGIPIEGERGVGYLLREPIFLPPMTLRDDELEALHLGIAMVKASADEAIATAAQDLLLKIEAVLPSHAPRFGYNWGHAVFVQALNAHSKLALATIRRALKGSLKLSISYEKPGEEPITRVVWPLQTEFWGKSWTLTAWCELRADFRVFRIDRITFCTALEYRFVPSKGQRLEDYLKSIQPIAP